MKFQVDRIWKGKVGTSAVVTTGMGGGDCGFGFSAGEDYLVYAYASRPATYVLEEFKRVRSLEEFRDALALLVDYGISGRLSGELGTGICTRTQRLSAAAEDMRALGPGAAPSDSGVHPLALVILLAGMFLGLVLVRRRRSAPTRDHES